MYVFNMLTDMLPPKLRPLAKAVYPAAATLVAIAAQWFASGQLDRAELVTAVVGLGAAFLTYLIPNAKPTASKS